MKEDLLTIKEFAEAAGVTQQALYQRLNKSLQGYVVEVNGKKHLKRDALSIFSKPLQQQEENRAEPDSTHIEQDLIKTLQTTINVLQDQLKAKDQQIAELNERLRDALEISKAHIVITAAEKQLPPTQEEIQEAEAKPEEKPGVFKWFKRWWS